jgi:hypothetical protein
MSACEAIKTVEWNGGIWTKPAALRELETYRRNLAMARAEMAAGNTNVQAFAEAWACYVDDLTRLVWMFDRP